ncbi:hypothetical protein QYM36_007320, partial [Artemia franciscana]
MDPGQILLSPAMNVNGPSELEALSPSFLMNQQNVMQPILQNSLPSNQETLPVGMYQNNLSPIPLTLPVSQFVNHNMQVPFYPFPVYMTNQSTSNQTAPGTSIQYATGTTNQGQMPRMIPNLQNIYQKDNQTRTMLKVPKQMPQFPNVYANIPTHNKFEVLPQDEDPLNECESDLNESDLNEVINPAVAEGLMDISNHTQKQKWCNASPGTSDVRQSRKQEIRAHTKAQVEIPEQEIFNNQVMLQDLVLHSDHNPVIVEIGSKYPTGINERRDKFRTGNVNWDDLTAKLKDVNIRAVIEGEAEIDKKIEAFQDHLVCTAKEIVPFGPVGFSKRKKSLPPNWTSALLDILNLAWSQGKFPTVWKYAEAVMIPKGGKDLSKLENHRMISLLPVLGKVYERIVKKRLNFEIERRKLLKDIQCGFRRKRSTIDCLNCIKQDALYAMQNNWIMLLVMLDVEGAFNNIVHRQILSGLIEAGFKGSLIAFVEDYMKQRTIKVRVKGLVHVYFIAFVSFYYQLKGLYGRHGILPAHRFLKCHSEILYCFAERPTLAWFAPFFNLDVEHMLEFISLVAIVWCICVSCFSTHSPGMTTMTVLWISYLSLVNIGQTFMRFQWDQLLLEVGFLSIFVSPLSSSKWAGPRSIIAMELVRWLMFRLMFASGVVKLTSGCPLWWSLNALPVHYESQCLPTRPAWWLYQLPKCVHQFSVIMTFVIEIALPFLFYAPFKQLRRIAAYGQPSYSTINTEVHQSIWPELHKLSDKVSSFNIVGSYGLFRRMTGADGRPELILEGADKLGGPWQELEFKFKPGNVRKPNKFTAYLQPRLDWQMWFAALSDYQHNPWLISLVYRILIGEKEVYRLMDMESFSDFSPAKPPKYVRGTLYTYRYAPI